MRDLSVCQCALQRLIEPDLLIELGAGLLVKAVSKIIHPACGAPIRHHPTRIMPIAFEDLIEQERAAAGPSPIDLVVRTHDRARMAALDYQLEREQIRLA